MKFSEQKYNLGLDSSFVRATYKDGSTIEPLSKNYKGLKRKGLKSASVIVDGKPIYTLDIVNNQLTYRLRNLAHGMVANFEKTKRCFVLGTKGKVAFVWDSNEIKEFKDWQKVEPYSKPSIFEDEV